MSDAGSVTVWIRGLKNGEETAAAELWSRYYTQLVQLALKRLRGSRRRHADEEDVVVQVFENLCRGAREGKFPKLRDRNDLWCLLFKITERKASNQVRDERRKKRGGGNVAGESALDGADSRCAAPGIEQVPSPEPTPQLAAMMADVVEDLLGQLDEPLRQVARLKLEGYSTKEIAEKTARSGPTVRRRLKTIQDQWEGIELG